MSKADDIFFREFGAILGILAIFAVVSYFIANAIHNDELDRILNTKRAVAARIIPEATAQIGDPSKVQAAEQSSAMMALATPAAGAGDDQSGEAIYNSVCAACHTPGVAGAPKLGDAGAWDARLAQGTDTLYTSVIKGKGAMPAKGGNPALSDDAIKSAVDFMLAALKSASLRTK